MKKAKLLVLILSTCLLMCTGCGAKKEYSFGESITTSKFVFTPEFGGFSEQLGAQGLYDEYLFRPEPSDITYRVKDRVKNYAPIKARSGRTMMYFSGTIEYIGNSKKNETFSYGATVNYDNGYTYTVEDFAFEDHGAWDFELSRLKGQTTYEKLIDDDQKTRMTRCCVEVPKQVEENADKRLTVTFKINGRKYTYRIR